MRGIQVKTPQGGGQPSYEAVDKILGKMAIEASKNKGEKYILIIDEINRANVASVLGELIYALEYRGCAVDSPYEVKNDSKIKIPTNLYIVGTMNTADRSIGHIDYAVRRRFAFLPLLPDRIVIESHYSLQNPSMGKCVAELFDAVTKLFDDNLSSDFYKDDVQVGHTYFLSSGTDKEIQERILLKFVYQVYPLLREYYKDGILIGKDVKINLKFVSPISIAKRQSPDKLHETLSEYFAQCCKNIGVSAPIPGSGDDEAEQNSAESGSALGNDEQQTL